jgi:hypothetical protein
MVSGLAGPLVGCELVQGLQHATLDTGGASGTASSAGAGGSAGSTGAGGTAPGCVPSEQIKPVDDACGVFVSASKGSDASPGSKEAPVATIEQAVKIAGGRPVYLCAEKFTGPVTFAATAIVYGGLDCATDWKYVGSKTRTGISAPSDAIPVRIGQGTGAELYDLAIEAAEGMSPSASSIAVIAETGANVLLTRCGLVANNGAPGQPGLNYNTVANDGTKGTTGAAACSAAQTSTPAPPDTTCGNLVSEGGQGGSGLPALGGKGGSGLPIGSDNGGAGASAMAVCENGKDGADGKTGTPGLGASGIGVIDAMGYTGVIGGQGANGQIGQGGGGGGGEKGGSGANKCPDATKAAGASGGSGGSGGCGGQGGRGGTPGGSSIGIISLGAQLRFKSTTINVKNGGEGGGGGNGEAGGGRGSGGAGGDVPAGAVLLQFGCSGGAGGKGGSGGSGGGGLGGHSIGIAYTGMAPAGDGLTIIVGNSGAGGVGDPFTKTSIGAPGVAKEQQAF